MGKEGQEAAPGRGRYDGKDLGRCPLADKKRCRRGRKQSKEGWAPKRRRREGVR